MSNLANLENLLVCRPLLSDEIIKKCLEAAELPSSTTTRYEAAYRLIALAETLHLSGNLFSSYLVYLMTQGNNLIAETIERCNGEIGSSLKNAFLSDLNILHPFFHMKTSSFLALPILDDYKPTKIGENTMLAKLQQKLKTAVSAEETSEFFLSYYRTYGFGDIANFRAFRWDEKKKLAGIQHFENISLEDLIGYTYQKNLLIANTEAYLDGKAANNALLVGARGTGKSSTVKALANHYFSRGLRLVEITKNQLTSLPQIMETLRQSSSKKFILFLDDLSFEEFEIEYKYLKSAIEGGVEGKPTNVLIYATSNRRHLIKETWKNRGAENDDIHRADTLNETISLSDRFGLTISYLSPNQEEYLQIVLALAKKHALPQTEEELRRGAIEWELSHSGRSGRTAQQYINQLLGAT